MFDLKINLSSSPPQFQDSVVAPLHASSNRVFIRFHAEYTTQLSGFEIMWSSWVRRAGCDPRTLPLPGAVKRNPAQSSAVLIPVSAHAIKHGLSFYGLYKRKSMAGFRHSVFWRQSTALFHSGVHTASLPDAPSGRHLLKTFFKGWNLSWHIDVYFQKLMIQIDVSFPLYKSQSTCNKHLLKPYSSIVSISHPSGSGCHCGLG